MILFGKTITRVFTLNFFKDQSLNQRLTDFFDGKLEAEIVNITSREAFFENLELIASEASGETVLLNIVGHGSEDRLRFGETPISVPWSEVLKFLQDINERSGNNLILNASLMCYSDGLENIGALEPQTFYGAIFSCSSRSDQALKQLLNAFNKCWKADVIIEALEHENNCIEDSSEEPNDRPFGTYVP